MTGTVGEGGCPQTGRRKRLQICRTWERIHDFSASCQVARPATGL